MSPWLHSLLEWVTPTRNFAATAPSRGELGDKPHQLFTLPLMGAEGGRDKRLAPEVGPTVRGGVKGLF